MCGIPAGVPSATHAINCNLDGADTTPYDVFDYAHHCYVRAEQGWTGEMIGNELGWKRTQVVNYLAIKHKLCPVAYETAKNCVTTKSEIVTDEENSLVTPTCHNCDRWKESHLRALLKHLADDDNENDEYHEPVGLVDMWLSYKALADTPGWTQERIGRAKGCSQTYVNFRVRLAELPLSVLEIITTHSVNERQARELLNLLPGNNLVPWLTYETALLYVVDQALESVPTAQTA